MVDGQRHWFSRFLQRRRALQHFGRHPHVETLAATGPAQAIPVELATPLMQVALEGFAWLAGILVCYCVLVTLMKRFYIRRFGWQ